jgi:hypothetical protein
MAGQKASLSFGDSSSRSVMNAMRKDSTRGLLAGWANAIQGRKSKRRVAKRGGIGIKGLR